MDQSTLQQALATLPGWKLEDGMLRKTYTFKNFVAALAWVLQVGFLAEAHGHHPDIDIRYNRVTLALVTHDAGNQITDKDLELARAIEALAA
ncbi:4a-hydroxytetrahydrobiopterin dehydratase [Kallotenue papyrolyticum]|uniref:4a-hydroxytetrahydrobiopterin dehydratase n=1 Tax=Kallotenue papyrolyticum TaxID=1325125 RepID=UPI0004B47A8A|nr:4a-hydroxytetrahydrobiopterin dehydratase [Kallotenue papyrolyticum]